MKKTNKEIKRVLVTLDMTDMDSLLIQYANFLSSKLNSIEHITFCHNIRFDFLGKSRDLIQKLEKPLRDILLEKITEKVDKHFHVDVQWNVIITEQSDSAEAIYSIQNNQNSDLIIFGKKNSYTGSGYLIERTIAKHPDSHLLVVPETTYHQIEKVAVPVDFTEKSAKVLQYIIELSKEMDTVTLPVHAYSLPKIYFPYIPSGNINEQAEKKNKDDSMKFINKYFPDSNVEIDFLFHPDRTSTRLLYDYTLNNRVDLLAVPLEKSIHPMLNQLLKSDMHIPVLVVRF